MSGNPIPSGAQLRSRRRIDVEQRMRVERTTALAAILRTMPTDCATALLARVLYDAPMQLIAEQLHIDVESAEHLVGLGISSMRHPSRAQLLKSVLTQEGDDDTLLIDGEMRALIRQWRLEERFAPRCEQCERPYSAKPPAFQWSAKARDWRGQQGRPRRYCSAACRQKAYRERRRQADRALREPDDIPEPQAPDNGMDSG